MGMAKKAVWLCILCAAAAAPTREEKDNTPTPCKDVYPDADVVSWVDEHLRSAARGRDVPQLLLMLGGSGAGKGTFVDRWNATQSSREDRPAHPLSGFVFHGLDEYLPYIPEYRSSVDDQAFVYKDAADACYKPAAIPAAKLAGKRIVEGKMDLIYEETGKSLDRIMKRVLPDFTKASYRVTTVLIHNKPDVAIQRSAGRFQRTGRYAADDYIRGTFANNLETYLELKQVSSIFPADGLAEFVYCDNSGSEMKCWQDGLSDAQGGPLVPTEILLPGSAVYLGSGSAAGRGSEL